MMFFCRGKDFYRVLLSWLRVVRWFCVENKLFLLEFSMR